MATRKVPVTSVTPASKVTAVSKAQQARTRNLVMGIASVTPVGRVAKGAATVAKAASGARKASTLAKTSRQAGDYAISGKSAKSVMPKAGSGGGNYRFGRDTEITKNVSIKNTKSPSGKVDIRGGAAQAMRQEMRLSQPISKAEAKANARGLKAANKPTNKTGAKADRTERKIINKNFNAPAKTNYVQQLRREGTSPRKTTRGK